MAGLGLERTDSNQLRKR